MEQQKYLKVLQVMYDIQAESFFPIEAMPKVIERLGLSEEEAVDYVKYFLDEGLLKKPAHKSSFFLRAGNIRNFPVILTSNGIARLKKNKK